MAMTIRGAVPGAAAGLLLLLTAPAVAAPGVADADLAEAGRQAPVRALDYGDDRCDPRTVDQWLHDLAGREARAIRWTGGPCRLVGPGIDAGSRWCARAEIVLRRPARRRDRPAIEVFFESPVAGRPGEAYAFRAVMPTDTGGELIRFRREFEAAWVARFPEAAGRVIDCPSD